MHNCHLHLVQMEQRFYPQILHWYNSLLMGKAKQNPNAIYE